MAVLYLTRIGLPDFAKRPLLENLHARGLDLQFSHLHLSWYRGIVAENVRFGRADEPLSPELTAAQVQLRLNHRALARLQFRIDGLVLRQGRLVWPLAETNQTPRELTIENIQTELRFLPGDQWVLDEFTAGLAGARIQLSCTVAHASAVREWRLLKAERPAPSGAWRNRLREFTDALDRVHFSTPPTLRLDVRGDGRDPASFGVRLLLDTPGADTPWGTVNRGRFTGRLFPADTNGISSADLSLDATAARTRWATTANLQLTAHLRSFESLTNLGDGELKLRAGHAETEWGGVTNLQLTIRGAAMAGQTNLINADLVLRAGQVGTRWGAASDAEFKAQWIHALTNAIPLSGDGTFRCGRAKTDWGVAKELRLNLHLAAPPAKGLLAADESWAAWATLGPYPLDWDGRVGGLQFRGLEMQDITCGGTGARPSLRSPI